MLNTAPVMTRSRNLSVQNSGSRVQGLMFLGKPRFNFEQHVSSLFLSFIYVLDVGTAPVTVQSRNPMVQNLGSRV